MAKRVLKILLLLFLTASICVTAAGVLFSWPLFRRLRFWENQSKDDFKIVSIKVEAADGGQPHFSAGSALDKAKLAVTGVSALGEEKRLTAKQFRLAPGTAPESGHSFRITVTAENSAETGSEPEAEETLSLQTEALLDREIDMEFALGAENPEDVTAVVYKNGDMEILGAGEARAYEDEGVPWAHTAFPRKLTWIAPEVTISSMDHWFEGNQQFTGMTCPVPATVKSMVRTFAVCTKLTEAPDLSAAVSLSDMTETFYACSTLQEAPAFPANVQIAKKTFGSCTSLIRAADVSACVQLASMESCYSGDISLVKDGTPECVRNLQSCYKGCINLKTVRIPPSVEDISYAFEGCSALVSVDGTITDACQEMGGAFSGCRFLSGDLEIETSRRDLYGVFSGTAVSGGILNLKITYVGETDEFASRADILRELIGQIRDQAARDGSHIVVNAGEQETVEASLLPAETEAIPETTTAMETTTVEETLPPETTTEEAVEMPPETSPAQPEPETTRKKETETEYNSGGSGKTWQEEPETKAKKKKTQKSGKFDG